MFATHNLNAYKRLPTPGYALKHRCPQVRFGAFGKLAGRDQPSQSGGSTEAVGSGVTGHGGPPDGGGRRPVLGDQLGVAMIRRYGAISM